MADRVDRTPILAKVAELSVAELRTRLDGLTTRDAARLGRRLKNLRAKPDKLRQLAPHMAQAEALVATRQAAASRSASILCGSRSPTH